jgi:anti-anti-sigma factor
VPDLSHPADNRESAVAGRPQATEDHDFLWFSIAEDRDEVTVSLEGELDVITLPDVALALEVARTRGSRITLDCAQLRFIDAAAVRFLRGARDVARFSGGDLTLRNPQQIVRKLLRLTDSLPLLSQQNIPDATIPVIPGRTVVFQAAVAAAAEVIGAPRANLQLADPLSGQLRIVAQRGFGRPFLEFFDVVDDTSSACGTALGTGTSVWVPDVPRSPIFSGTTAQVMADAGAAAVASVPIRAPGGELIGVISAHPGVPVSWEYVTKQQLERLARATGRLLLEQRTGLCP